MALVTLYDAFSSYRVTIQDSVVMLDYWASEDLSSIFAPLTPFPFIITVTLINFYPRDHPFNSFPSSTPSYLSSLALPRPFIDISSFTALRFDQQSFLLQFDSPLP